MSTILQSLNSDLTTLIEKVRPSLVQISNGHAGQGAGTIWHGDGLIITNAHVVQHHHLKVTLADGRTFPARILAHDPQRDLAALSIEAQNLPTVELGNSQRLMPGEWLLGIGHPWGVPGAVTAGSVITVGPHPEMRFYAGDLIQVDMHLRPGHSGGPMVDGRGRVVGINTMINGPNVGLAVPVHVVKAFLQEKIRKQ